MKTVDHFIESLSRLNEKKFFEISRNFLGDVKTPYNKQAIIERLISQLSNREWQEVMFSYITADDALVINTIELLDCPTLHDIYAFFAAQFSYGECIRFTASLEERLIIYSFIDSGKECYALNPVFGILRRVLDQKSVLFPCLKKRKPPNASIDAPSPDTPPIGKMFLFAFFSFVYSRKIQVKSDYTLARKTEDEAASFFHGYGFAELLAASDYLGLVYISGHAYHVDMRAVEDFLKLPDRECRSYLAAGMCADKRYAPFAVRFLSSLLPGNQYTSTAVYRMLWIIFRKSALHFAPAFDKFLAALQKTGLLAGAEDAQTGEKWFALPQTRTAQTGGTHNVPENAPISLLFDSPFSFIVLPDTDILALFDILSFSAIENMQEYRFTVNKETVVRCFETGGRTGDSAGNAAWIIDRLAAFSGGRVDEALVWTLNEWEKRFSEVVLHEGLVLYLGKERLYLAETAGLKPYLKKAVTENVFIIDPRHRDAVEAALSKSGVDIIGSAPAAENQDSLSLDFGRRPAAFPSLSGDSLAPDFFIQDDAPAPAIPAAADYRALFKTILASLGAAVNEKQELLVRIDRGLIFSADQLKKLALPGTFPYEKNEAHGMDYTGKLIIARSALANRNPVEISWRTDTEETKLLCTIRDIEKTQSGDTLLVSANQQDQKIPLGKISRIRRIKQSIFE